MGSFWEENSRSPSHKTQSMHPLPRREMGPYILSPERGTGLTSRQVPILPVLATESLLMAHLVRGWQHKRGTLHWAPRWGLCPAVCVFNILIPFVQHAHIFSCAGPDSTNHVASLSWSHTHLPGIDGSSYRPQSLGHYCFQARCFVPALTWKVAASSYLENGCCPFIKRPENPFEM